MKIRSSLLACTSAIAIALLALPSVAFAAKTKHGKPQPKVIRAAHTKSLAAERKPVSDEPEFANFNEWRAVRDFIDEMATEHGFERDALRELFTQVHYMDRVVKLINPPPAGKAKNWSAYRDRFIEPRRLNAGVAFWNQHARALERAQEEFGVPAEIIVGILGVETIYGQATGKFRVLDALSTLAFAYPDTPNREPRMKYFRGELKQALLYARESNIDPFSLSGSFAGAIGWPQFMPGSLRRFAVDFDGDGKIDLRNSPIDAIGSVASFLSQHGWMRGQPVVFPLSSAPEAALPSLTGRGLEATFSRENLQQTGLPIPDDLPASLNYGLVDLQDGERPPLYLLGTANFFAITQYNRSFYYAMAVIELGKAVGKMRTP